MLRSSLGFHTLTFFLKLTSEEAKRLKEHFQRYSKDTGLINIFPLDNPRRITRTVFDRGKAIRIKEVKANYAVNYFQTDRGIEWLIRYNNWSYDFQSYIIEVTINPKILGGIHDYITAATYDDMEAAVTNFNLEAKRISPLLKSFGSYSLKRVDYCINFDLNELATGCTPERIIELIKRGNIPPHYKEFMEYDDKAHRMKSKPGSFYLINRCANVNCYSKLFALQNRSREREGRGLSTIPQATLDAAHGIIRFEVQCKYHKTYTLSKRVEASGNHDYNKYESLLSHVMCIDTISHYFKKVIGKGDWHTLKNATHIIECQHYNKQREKRLIDALQLVNQCRSVVKAKATFQGDCLADFKRTLKDLSRLNINPVTIPKEWGIKYIPNLLYAYHDKVQQEMNKKQMKAFRSECLDEYIKEFGCLPE